MRGGHVLAGVLLVRCLALAAPEQKAPAAETPIGEKTLATLKARAIGPATMGGRVSSIALDPADPATFYVGLGTGGIMKTTNAGGSFSAIFEKASVASIGAIAIAPSSSQVIWVGSGEANDRNSSSWGDGVYRSEDAGDHFKNVGLKGSRSIARIVVHPKDAKTAWVAVMGDLWTPSAGRGLFKTSDAGASWTRVLAAPAPYDDRVGCGDVVIDPSNADVLYAALYARRRTPWSFTFGSALTDGKDLGGVFRSTDGGAHWSRLTAGLPKETGRIGLAVFAKNPKIVYALVQADPEGGAGWGVRAKSGGVFRSEDAGANFTRVNPLNPRPFYFSQIRIDPENDKRIYVLGFLVHVSDDGGTTFREDAFKKVHPDCHALVIDQGKRERLLLGTDGGLYQSYDAGKTWDFLNRFSAGEFYRVNVDMSTPYRICGGLQDNLNWVGPSRTFSKDGIVNEDWTNIGGGDGFSCVFDPNDPNIVYAESQEGELHRFDLGSGAAKTLKPEPNEGQPRFRFHWNAPLIGSAHEPGILYLGGNRVFRFSEKGERWSMISPDLSARIADRIDTTGSGAETYGVVYTLDESPTKTGMLWAGTDDGKLWVTENEGKSWIDLSAKLPSAAKGEWISRIEAGQDPGVAYLAVDAHRSGSLAPMAWRTADRGKTWESIAGDLPLDQPVKVVREDPVNPSLLYAGTEFALFVSLDRGKHWTKFGALPTVAVDDILIHPRDRDLVIATHGRSLFVIDDLTPIEGLTPETRLKEAYLFPVRKALGRFLLPGFEEWSGSTVFRGANPPDGALLSYWIKEGGPEPVKIEIKNAQGQTVANLTTSAVSGINRTSWDLKPTKDVLVEYGGEGSLFVRPGVYEATLKYGQETSKQSIEVAIAPGIETR